MNPQLTAAQERARAFVEMQKRNGVDITQDKAWTDTLMVATWNDAIAAAESIMAKEKELTPITEKGGVRNTMISQENNLKAGFNACRTETLQALAKLKV
jgi:hypothetical protein